MKPALWSLAAVAALSSSAYGGQDGTSGLWRDTDRVTKQYGSVTSGSVTGNTFSSTTTTIRRTYQQYAIETDDHVYFAEQSYDFGGRKPSSSRLMRAYAFRSTKIV